MSTKPGVTVERKEMEFVPSSFSSETKFRGLLEEQEGLLTEATESLAVTANHR